ATVTSPTTDPNGANNSDSHTFAVGCPAAPRAVQPSQGQSNVPASGLLDWNDTGASQYRVFLGPAAAGGCETLLLTTARSSAQYNNLEPGTEYAWRVEAVAAGCPTRGSACTTFRTAVSCNTAPPQLLAPIGGATVASTVTFTWTPVAGAASYDVFTVSNGTTVKIGTTSATSLAFDLPDGPLTWYVVANGVSGCGPLQSAPAAIGVCNVPAAPLPSVVADTQSGQTYTLSWAAVAGAIRYEVDEASNAAFNRAQTQSVTATSLLITKIVSNAQPFFYRVRAFTACSARPSLDSPAVRIVVQPPPSPTDPNPNSNVPAGSKRPTVLRVFVPGQGSGNVTFAATVDKPWLTVNPSAGLLPPEGITLDVTADPASLPNGTFTGTVIVAIDDGVRALGHAIANGTTVKKTPVSISLVTPVSPATGAFAGEGSLIIPSVGHLDGLASRWRSDVRLANTTLDSGRYQLTFSPEDPALATQDTIVEIEAGRTMALDDIVRNWYGIGSLGEASNGMLAIRPLAPASSGNERTTAVSSRTFNSTANGSLGQFIPAIPFSNFIAAPAQNQARPVLSLQQIAQSSAFRTNVGLVEASGHPVDVVLSIFDSAGTKLRAVPVSLAAGEQRQLNGFLTANGISLEDGRIEVTAVGGEGRVTAYASVVDNRSGDPLLVSPVQLGAETSRRYVLPGAADLNTPVAAWRTDMRVLNASSSPQTAQLTFHPQANGAPLTASLTINPGETRRLDNVLQSLFGARDTAGAVHVSTPNDSTLVVTGRTYNQTGGGTLGQFIPAVTPAEAVAAGQPALQILQAEESVRYRTNLGLAEVNGQAAHVQVSVILPDSRTTPQIELDLAPNEFRQLAILRDLGFDGAYNARIEVRVTGGAGSVTAYGSVVDMTTQDPTYIPAQ
ncbi:MAG TPA: hypothetical protein VF698_16200, partial [Thermoanaerobaculia bacterium]